MKKLLLFTSKQELYIYDSSHFQEAKHGIWLWNGKWTYFPTKIFSPFLSCSLGKMCVFPLCLNEVKRLVRSAPTVEEYFYFNPLSMRVVGFCNERSFYLEINGNNAYVRFEENNRLKEYRRFVKILRLSLYCGQIYIQLEYFTILFTIEIKLEENSYTNCQRGVTKIFIDYLFKKDLFSIYDSYVHICI